MNAPHPSDDVSASRLAALERRLARLEAHLGLETGLPAEEKSPAAGIPAPAESAAPVSFPTPVAAATAATADDLEFQVGQNAFARIGIVVLALGAGFTLSLPLPGLPAIGPALIGYALAAGFLLLARFRRDALASLAGEFSGVAMLLLFFATLRLHFFSSRPTLDFHTVGGQSVLVLALAANVGIAWRPRNAWLLGLALVIGGLGPLAVGTPDFVLPGLVLLAAVAVALSIRGHWPGLWLAAIPLVPVTALLWALNDPLLGHPFQWVAIPPAAPYFALASTAILATWPLWHRREAAAGAVNLPDAAALLNCALGFGLFLLLTLLGPVGGFVPAQLAAAAVLLALAAALRGRGVGEIPPFAYAMTGNLALSLAIVRFSAMPAVFVWLSVQSLLVVAVAVWLRSRFIVVGNFFIYVFIVLAYAVLADRETGISVGFGLVALASARILHWQKDRLVLKTEVMRNAYLAGAFVVFPYALYHLVPVRQVGLAWVGLALFYYAMNLIVRSPKFRWMGHATLLLATVYLLMVGTREFEPVYRVLSFLVLGTVLLVVSLVFTRLRRPRAPTQSRTS
jgi:hypothetical protein